MEKGESEQEQQEDKNPQHNLPEEHEVEIRSESPLQEDYLPQGVNAPISGPSLGRINRPVEETEMKRNPTLASHVKRKHIKESTKASVTSVQNLIQIPSISRSRAIATSVEGENIPPTLRCQRETASPTDSPLYKRHKIQSDEISASKSAIEISSDSASSPEEQKSSSPEPATSPEEQKSSSPEPATSPEEQKSSSPEPGTSSEAQFHEETEEVTEGSEESREDLLIEQQPDTLNTRPALSTQKASSPENSQETSGTLSQGTSSASDKFTCRVPINKKTRAALTLYILGNRSVKEKEESSDIVDPLIVNDSPVENLECPQIVQSSVPFDVPVIKSIERTVDSRLMRPPETKIKGFTPPKKIRYVVLKENKRESKTWWCIDSVTSFPSDQLHDRFRSSHATNRANWNITSYSKNLLSNQPGSLQFSSGLHDLRTEPTEVEPADMDEEFVGRPSINGTSKRILGLVPHIGNITQTSILWNEPNPNEVFCRGIKRCKLCGMPQGLFTRLPITVKLLWYNSFNEKQMPYTDTVECAFPVDIWGATSLLKIQDSNVGWILNSKVLDVDWMLLKYAETEDYEGETFESKSAKGKSSGRKTSERKASESASSEGESSER